MARLVMQSGSAGADRENFMFMQSCRGCGTLPTPTQQQQHKPQTTPSRSPTETRPKPRDKRGGDRYVANRSPTNSPISPKLHAKSSPNCSGCNRTLTMTRSQLSLVTGTRHDVLHTRLIIVETTPCTLIDLSFKPHMFKTKEFHSWTRNTVTWLLAQVAGVNAGLDCQQDSSLCVCHDDIF